MSQVGPFVYAKNERRKLRALTCQSCGATFFGRPHRKACSKRCVGLMTAPAGPPRRTEVEWTQQEIALVRRAYPDGLSPAAIGAQIGRTADAVSSYAAKFGIKRRDRYAVLQTRKMDVEANKQRFLEKVRIGEDGDCWRWTGAARSLGYGVFELFGRTQPAHRAAYILYCEPIPAGMYVCHHCDNPWCVNPEHLFVGTQKDNIADCIAKGRKTDPPRTDWKIRTKPHHWQRLTEAQAREIIKRAFAGESQRLLAAEFGINRKHVSSIKVGHSWPQLERP